MDSEVLYTIPEAADRARLATRTMGRAIAQGRLRVVRPGGFRRVLVPASALKAFIHNVDEKAVPPTECKGAILQAARVGLGERHVDEEAKSRP